jgi:methyl-accepting chemotaxis protein
MSSLSPDERSQQNSEENSSVTNYLWEAYKAQTDVGETEDEKLRQERDFWKAMFDKLVDDFPEGVLVTTDNGTLTHWNETLSDHLNIPASEALGNNAYDVIGTENKDETLAETVVRKGEPIQEEDVREVPTTDAIFQTYGVPLRGPDGSVIGAFEVAPDVSEHVLRQRELEEIQDKVGGTVRSELTDLSESINDIVSFTDEIEAFAEKQTEHMEQAAGEISNQSATIEEIASSAESVSSAAQQANTQASDGKKKASTAIDRMEAVREQADDVTDTLNALTAQADEMNEIIEVIDGIAEQTNMLALNASIEAARAGEAGDGFAVVADEIKNLAGDSQQQASEIEGMVHEMISMTEQTEEELNKTTAEIADAIEAVEDSVGALQEISEAISETATGAEEVAEATDAHASSSEEVAATVDAAVEELSSLEQQLVELSDTTSSQKHQVEDISRAVDELVDQ